MSHIMTALAMRQSGLKPAAKIVLYWLADHHNGETGQCNPSINRIAKCCEMSRRSVENHLKTLEDAGLIQIKNCHREKGGKTSNSYILTMEESDAQNLRMGYAKSAHGDTQNLRMKNLGNNNIGNEQVEDTNVSFQVSSANDLSQAVSRYNDAAAKAGWPQVQKLSPTRSKQLKARLIDCAGLDGWEVALRKAFDSDFCRGRTPNPWSGFGFDWLVKSSNFTKLMEGNYDNRYNQSRPSVGISGGQQNRSDPALEQISRLAGLSQASGNGGG